MGQDRDGTDGHPGPRTARQEIERLTLQALVQGQQLAELETTVRQLQTALDSRIVIERANGVLAERYDLSMDDAFTLLRKAARTSRRPLRQLASDVVETPRRISPADIVEGLRRMDDNRGVKPCSEEAASHPAAAGAADRIRVRD